MRSSAGSELLTRCRIVGTPTAGIPRNTVSTKPGLVGVPNSLLKISMQVLPPWVHCGVAALADSVPTVLTPPITVSVAAAVSSLLLIDMTVPFLERLGVDQDRIGADAIILRRPADPADQGRPWQVPW
jgi:hypothetical protein